jgi:hypothetical protein
MSLEKNIKLKVTADTNQAQQNLGNISKSVNRLGTSFKELGSYIGLAFGAQQIGSFLTDSVKAFIESERVVFKLGNTLKSNTKTLTDYAHSLQEITRFEDDSIISGMSRLTLFTKDESLIKRLTKATLDFASATETDLGTSFEMMSKAITGDTIAFGKLGLKIEDTGDPLKNLNLLLDKINKTMGGSSESEANTTYGRLEKLKNKFEDFKEEIGGGLVPTLNTVATSLDSIAKGFGQSGGFSDLLDKYLKIATVVPVGLLKLLGMLSGGKDYDGTGDIMSASKYTKGNIMQSQSYTNWKTSLNDIKTTTTEIKENYKEIEKIITGFSAEGKRMDLASLGLSSPMANIIGKQNGDKGKAGKGGITDEFKNQVDFFVSQMKDGIGIIKGEFSTFWEDSFGEANSLLEKFLMNFAEGLMELALKQGFSSLLNMILPGAGTLAGMAMGASRNPSIINLQMDNRTVAQFYVNGKTQASRLRMN